MPIYEYKCESCQHSLEALQKLSDAPLVDCPECGKPALKKQVTAAAFKLKGGGWYETDFKNKDKKGAPEKKADAGSDSAAPASDKKSEQTASSSKAADA